MKSKISCWEVISFSPEPHFGPRTCTNFTCFWSYNSTSLPRSEYTCVCRNTNRQLFFVDARGNMYHYLFNQYSLFAINKEFAFLISVNNIFSFSHSLINSSKCCSPTTSSLRSVAAIIMPI